MCARAFISRQDISYAASLDPGHRAAVQAAADEVDREISRVRGIPDEVSCSVRVVCYLAGKSYVYDRYGVEQMLATNRATSAEIDAKAHGIRFENVSDAALW